MMTQLDSDLSICIPTYNRDYLLDECLKRLLPIASARGIGVYVSDNASPDDTQSVVESHRRVYPCLHYFRQAENIGPDRNFEFVLKMPTTKYVWLYGDAACVGESDFDALLTYIRQTDADIVVCGGKGRTDGMLNAVYDDRSRLLAELGWHMTFLSCLVYSKRLIKAANFRRYYNSRFIQTGIIFEYGAFEPLSAALVADTVVGEVNLPKRGHWFPLAFEVFCRDWYLFVMSLPVCYPYEVKLACIKAHALKTHLFSLKSLLRMRADGYFSRSILTKYGFFIRQTVDTRPFVLWFVSLIPKRLLRLIRRLKVNK